MIPRGRKVITPAEVAQRAGVSLPTWRRRDQETFHERVKPLQEGRRIIYDLEQTLAYLAGKPIPKLPAGEHPDDLLNDREVADLLGVAVPTVQAYRSTGYLPKGEHPKDADGQDITSIRVTTRRDVEARRDSLPEGHVPGRRGRPAGTAVQEEAAELIRSGQARTGRDLAAAIGITRRHGDRLLRRAEVPPRTPAKQQNLQRVAELLKEHGDSLSLSRIAEEVGVSKTEAHRLVQEVKADRTAPEDKR